MDYPSNSDKHKGEPPEDKKVERVTSGDATRRKKSLGKQLSETFVGGDPKSAIQYVCFDVLIPAAKDALSQGVSQGFERLIYGESKTARRSAPGATGYIAYNRMSQESRPSMSRSARARHDFDEIVLKDRAEAENVIDRLFEVTSKYGSATVADLYELVGLPATPVDQTWGWVDLRGSAVARVRNGFLLDVPDPEPLGK